MREGDALVENVAGTQTGTQTLTDRDRQGQTDRNRQTETDRQRQADRDRDKGLRAGLMTTGQPAARAGATFLVIMAAGKFHGVIREHTPTPWRITIMRLRVCLCVFSNICA